MLSIIRNTLQQDVLQDLYLKNYFLVQQETLKNSLLGCNIKETDLFILLLYAITTKQ